MPPPRPSAAAGTAHRFNCAVITTSIGPARAVASPLPPTEQAGTVAAGGYLAIRENRCGPVILGPVLSDCTDLLEMALSRKATPQLLLPCLRGGDAASASGDWSANQRQ